MLIILSKIEDVLTTNVMYWLRSDCKRINQALLSQDFYIESIYANEEQNFAIRTDNVDLGSADKIWFRRGDISMQMLDVVPTEFQRVAFYEINALKRFLIQKTDQKFVFNSYSDEKFHSKIRSLEIAQEAGLHIPPTLITCKKRDVTKFQIQYGDLICKAISGTIQRTDSAAIGTFEVSSSDIQELNEEFFPTLFQQKIEKRYEIRVFFIGDEIYPMAIIAGKRVCSIDYRDHYDTNRNVPYKLPNEIQDKILNFIKGINLFSGSIDLIYSAKKEYYFLEVNPTGQFGWVSKNCNFYLEKKVALTIDNILQKHE